MKQLLSLFLFLLPCLAWAQYPSNGNQKITLGEQTTADGLIYRGVASDTTLTVKSDTAAYFVLDTVNINLYTYKASATGRKWRQLGADTAAIAYVNTYGPQTVNGAKTFTTGPIISNSTNGDPNILRLSNTNTGTSAQTTMYILNQNTNTDGLFLGTLGTSFTTIGGFVQDAGMIGSGSNLSGGLSIMTRADQPMRFYTNGHTNERMRIAANGNIGIANNNPVNILDINGDRIKINSNTNNAGFVLSESGTNKWAIATVNGDFTFYDETNAIYRFIIKANGNIGIANNNPVNILDINGDRIRINSNTNNAGFFLSESGTNKWAIATVNGDFTFYDETNAIYRFIIKANGNIGIGQTTPTAVLHLKAGTATSSTAPLKFTSGTNLTTAEAGAMEFNGTNLFFSPSTTRHTVNHGLTGSATLNFPSTTTLLSADLTITVTGAADGDVVSLGVPNAAVNANTSYSAWVSAANTVTVRFNNYSSGAVDPASGLFKVFVTK
jgi:hypothetical protein